MATIGPEPHVASNGGLSTSSELLFAIWFKEPAYAVDGTSGYAFRSDRHAVQAASLTVDAQRVTLQGHRGDVVALWGAERVARIDWRRVDDAGTDRSGEHAIAPEVAGSLSSPAHSTVEGRRNIRGFRRWTPAEDARLRDELARGCSVERIATAHERSQAAIRSRIHKVKLDSRDLVIADVVA